MIGAVSGGIKLVKVLAIIGAAIFVINMIYSAGEDSMTAELQPVIKKWEERYNKLNNDLLLTASEEESDSKEDEMALEKVGVETEVDHVKRQAEIRAGVEAYLNKLDAASDGLLTPTNKGGTSIYTPSGEIRTLSALAKTLPDSCEGKYRLYSDLRELDRSIATEILAPYNQCQQEVADIKIYSQKIDKKMQEIKAENEKNKALIKATQP